MEWRQKSLTMTQLRLPWFFIFNSILNCFELISSYYFTFTTKNIDFQLSVDLTKHESQLHFVLRAKAIIKYFQSLSGECESWIWIVIGKYKYRNRHFCDDLFVFSASSCCWGLSISVKTFPGTKLHGTGAGRALNLVVYTKLNS